jgi:nitrogen fixation protein FixH
MTIAPLTGGKVLAITVAFFAVVISVNITLAYKAISTFPGLEVDNSYVASQTFDAEKTAQNALGWRLDVSAQAKIVSLGFTGRDGQPVQPQSLFATIGRATEGQDDSIPAFAYANGRYTAPVALNPGKWVLWVQAVAANGTAFRQRIALYIKG